MEKWRFLDLKVADAYTNMAVDEALVYARGEEKAKNTLRFYRWNPSAVTLGYFQSVEDEVDLEACKKFGIDVNRRISGGGAVLNSSYGEITYSIVMPEDDPWVSAYPTESYRYLCHGIIEGLANLGIEAAFKPINDIIAGSKKISGNAQTRGLNVVHQHGTILREVDPSLMFTVLLVPNEKIRDKLIKSVEERVTSINRFLKRKVAFKELKEALMNGCEDSFKIKLVPGETDKFEGQLAEKLRTEKYSAKEWNFKR